MSKAAFQAIDEILGGVAAAPTQQTAPHSLLDFAKQNHFRVTSGFSTHGHSPGSRHYQGNAKDPGAIDIDYRGVSLANLRKLAQQNGYTVLDEVSHPSRYSTGPHYHIQKGDRPARQPAAHTADQPKQAALPTSDVPSGISFPTMRPGQAFAPVGVDLSVPTRAQAQASNQKIKQSFAKPISVESTAQTAPKDSVSHQFDAIDKILAEAGKSKFPPRVAPAGPQNTNFFGDLYNNAVNAAAGYSQDELVRQSGHGVGAGIGQALGGLVPVGGAALGGAGLGALTLTPFGVAGGAIGGGIVGAGSAGAAQELQRQRLAGEGQDLLKAGGSALLQGGLQAIPVLKGANLLTTVGKNVALHGAAAAGGDVVQQGIEQGSFTPNIDPNRVAGSAALGAAGGTVAAGTHHLTTGRAPKVQEREIPSAFRDAANADRVYQSATQERLAHERAIAKKYKSPEQFESRLSELEKKVQDRSATQAEFKEHETARQLAEKQAELRRNADQANQYALEANTPQKREDVIRQMQPREREIQLTPEEQRRANPEYQPRGEAPDVQGLTRSFEERKQQAAPDVITPTRELPESVSGYKTEPTESGIQIATRAGERKIPEIETTSAVGGENVPLTKPRERSILLDQYGRQEPDIGQRPVQDARTKALLRAEEISKRPEREIGITREQPSTTRDIEAGLLDVQGRPYGKPVESAPIERPGQPREREVNLEYPQSYRRQAETPLEAPKQEKAAPQVSEPTKEQPAGSYTDTVNELLKDSGTDFNGVRSLANERNVIRGRLAEIGNSRSPEARELRAQRKAIDERWKAVPENIREIASVEFDPETGIGKQRVSPDAMTLDQVRSYINSDKGMGVAQKYHEAMTRGTKLIERYVAEQSGRSNEVAFAGKGGRVHVARTEFSPTHFSLRDVTFPGGPRRVVVAHGYNQRGHLAERYIEVSPKGSHVQQVLAITDKPAFKGPTGNVVQGAGEFNVTDILARGPRTERGLVKTSAAIKALHEERKALRDLARDAILPVDAKQRLEDLLNGQPVNYDDMMRLRKNMSEPSKLAAFCKYIGLS